MLPLRIVEEVHAASTKPCTPADQAEPDVVFLTADELVYQAEDTPEMGAPIIVVSL